MPTEKKDQAIAVLREKIAKSSNVFFTDFRGLTVGELRTLRTSLRKADSSYEIVKNTLFGIAIGDEKRAQLKTVLEGPTGVAFTGPDPVGAAKALTQFALESKKLTIKAAFVDGAFFDLPRIDALSKVPPRKELLTKLVGSLKNPIHGIVTVLGGHRAKIVHVLHALHEKKSAEAAA